MDPTTTLESLLENLQLSARACAQIRTDLDRLLAEDSPPVAAARERIRLWFEIIGLQAAAAKEGRDRWLAQAKRSGMDDAVVARLQSCADRQREGIGPCDGLAELAREDVGAAARGAQFAQAIERQLDDWIVMFADGSARANKIRQDLIAHAADRIEVLSRKMLRRSSIVVRSNVQTGDVFVGAAMRLMRALRHVSPLDPRAFFGLVGLQIRRELVDLARHFRRDAQAYSLDEPLEPARGRTDSPRNLECWTRFHDAVGRLPAEQREVVDLHWYQGLSQDEMTALLGVDKSTVKRRWRAARQWLADELQDCASVMLSG